MKEEILRILEMEKQGKLTTQQAAELLAALAESGQTAQGPAQGSAWAAGAAPASETEPGAGQQAAPPPQQPQPSQQPIGPSPFATLRGVVSTSGVLLADAVQAAVRNTISAVHHRDGNNNITISRYDSPKLQDAIFSGNTIGVSQFSGVQLLRARFCGNTIQASTIANVRVADGSLSDCQFNGSSLDELDLEGSRLTDTVFSGSKSARIRISGGSVIQDCAFNGAAFRDVSLSGGAKLRNCRFNGGIFASNALEDSTLEDVDFNAASLTDSHFMSGSQWHTVELTDCRVSGWTLKGSSFRNVELRELAASGDAPATFENCRLSAVRFVRCKLAGAAFHDLELHDVRVEDVDFTGKEVRGNDAFLQLLKVTASQNP